MYQAIYVERGEGFGNDTVHLWDDELGYKTVPYRQFDYAYKPDKSGQYISMTGVRLAKVKRYKRDDPSLFESDLPAETRVLTDLYLNEDNPSTGHKVMFFDIEVSMENGVPTIENPNNEITSIALYDSVTQQYSVLVLDKAGVQPSREYDNVNVVMYTSELDLLYGFLDVYEQIGPTIITGWNSDYFDVPYLYNRIKQRCGPNTAGRLSPIGKVRYSNFRSKYFIAGVSSLDYLDLYKKFTYTQQPNYRLDTIGRLEVDMGKVTYDGSLDELFRTDLEKFIEYNLQDVRIIVEMDKKLKLIELVRGICHIGHVPYEDYGFSSKFLEGTIVTYLHRKGIIVTNKPAGGRELMNARKENDEEGFAGAFVKEPTPGLYEWVYSLDLQSLYPSIIMSLNISKETKVGRVTNYSTEAHISEYFVMLEENEDVVVKLSREKFCKFMNKNNLVISSNGILYKKPIKNVVGKILEQK
jgi:DNA polymerase elongation subunit (family B)